MSVTVSIPFHGDRDMLRRCVRSILDQTHRDLRILVIADGMKTGLRYRDSRLHVYELPENRGAYYARAVAQAATDTPWHAVIDADDWVEPEWLDVMLDTGADIVWQRSRIDEHADRSKVMTWRNADRVPGPTLIHTSSHTGLYRTEALREYGGYNPAYRIGWDTLMVGILRLTGPFEVIDKPMYHRTIHAASLTNAVDTGIQSETRRRNREHLREIFLRAWKVRHNPDAVGEIVDDTFDPELAAEVEAHAANIRGVK